MPRRRRGGRARCPHDRKTVFGNYKDAAGAGARLDEPGQPYWCAQAGGWHIRRGDQADYDRRRAQHLDDGEVA